MLSMKTAFAVTRLIAPVFSRINICVAVPALRQVFSRSSFFAFLVEPTSHFAAWQREQFLA